MEIALKASKKNRAAAYVQLTKPGIIMGNLLTAFGGFMIARPQSSWICLLGWMLLGLACVIGSACAFNNIIDVDLDKTMARTAKRPLPQGQIGSGSAALLGSCLLMIGAALLFSCVNTLTMVLAICGWMLYVGVYSLMKYTTSFATWMGSIAGAIPPVVGYTAATNQLDIIALILFLIVACWQMPHFLAIGIFRIEDYAKANIPILPCILHFSITKGHMLCYLLGFSLGCWMLYCVADLSALFLAVMGSIGIVWLQVAIQGFYTREDKKWAKKMFLYSLVAITAFSLILPFAQGKKITWASCGNTTIKTI